MSEFVKKTIVGYKDVPGGSSDPDCTHVILTLNEYKKIVRERDEAIRTVGIERQNADRQMNEEKKNAASAACKLSGTARGEDRLLGHHIGASEADTTGSERYEAMRKAAVSNSGFSNSTECAKMPMLPNSGPVMGRR